MRSRCSFLALKLMIYMIISRQQVTLHSCGVVSYPKPIWIPLSIQAGRWQWYFLLLYLLFLSVFKCTCFQVQWAHPNQNSWLCFWTFVDMGLFMMPMRPAENQSFCAKLSQQMERTNIDKSVLLKNHLKFSVLHTNASTFQHATVESLDFNPLLLGTRDPLNTPLTVKTLKLFFMVGKHINVCDRCSKG